MSFISTINAKRQENFPLKNFLNEFRIAFYSELTRDQVINHFSYTLSNNYTFYVQIKCLPSYVFSRHTNTLMILDTIKIFLREFAESCENYIRIGYDVSISYIAEVITLDLSIDLLDTPDLHIYKRKLKIDGVKIHDLEYYLESLGSCLGSAAPQNP